MAATKKTATTNPDPSPKDSSTNLDDGAKLQLAAVQFLQRIDAKLNLLAEDAAEVKAVLMQIRDRLPAPQTATPMIGTLLPLQVCHHTNDVTSSPMILACGASPNRRTASVDWRNVTCPECLAKRA